MPGTPAAPPPGWVRMDCHLHTVASGDAVLTLDQLADRAEQAGLDVVCITDHNEISAAVAAAGQDLGVRIIVGEEIRTPDGDIIGLFLTERVPYVLPWPRSSPGYGPRAAWSTPRTRSTTAVPAWAGYCPACARRAPWTSSRSST